MKARREPRPPGFDSNTKMVGRQNSLKLLRRAIAVALLCAGAARASPVSYSVRKERHRATLRSSPVELRCEPALNGVPRVTIRNRTGHSLELSLHGLAFAERRGFVRVGGRLQPKEI